VRIVGLPKLALPEITTMFRSVRRFDSSRTTKTSRRGAITVLSALLIVFLCFLAAISVDISHMLHVRTELQRTADSAALASCWELIDRESLTGDPTKRKATRKARKLANQYSLLNEAGGVAVSVDTNNSNHVDGDVLVAQMPDLSRPQLMLLTDTSKFNAVRVRVRRDQERNGRVALFFGRVFGWNDTSLSAEATAVALSNIGGFAIPEDGSNLPILPITIRESAWDQAVQGNGDNDDDHESDQWSWNPETGSVEQEGDGISELTLYPENTGASGNLGTVNIGTDSNGTSNLGRQISEGLNQSDLDYHGGELKFDASGELTLSGDPGLSSGIKGNLKGIVGEKRLIPLYRSVTGDGSNAQFQLVRWVGGRLMEADLNGTHKAVIIQPVNMIVKGAIPSNSGETSQFVYGAVRLVR
jgi:Flp pilus assembly protein TadG